MSGVPRGPPFLPFPSTPAAAERVRTRKEKEKKTHRFMIWLAGTRESEQPIQRYRGVCPLAISLKKFLSAAAQLEAQRLYFFGVRFWGKGGGSLRLAREGEGDFSCRGLSGKRRRATERASEREKWEEDEIFSPPNGSRWRVVSVFSI